MAQSAFIAYMHILSTIAKVPCRPAQHLHQPAREDASFREPTRHNDPNTGRSRRDNGYRHCTEGRPAGPGNRRIPGTDTPGTGWGSSAAAVEVESFRDRPVADDALLYRCRSRRGWVLGLESVRSPGALAWIGEGDLH